MFRPIDRQSEDNFIRKDMRPRRSFQCMSGTEAAKDKPLPILPLILRNKSQAGDTQTEAATAARPTASLGWWRTWSLAVYSSERGRSKRFAFAPCDCGP
jgi:hypothetical protein